MIRTKKRMAWCVAWLIVNLAFIWGNSLLPGELSGALSNWVGDVLSRLIPGFEAGMPQEGRGLLRKFAHFSEFALLGMCLRWLFGMLTKAPKLYFLSALCGVAAAFVDEGIQMFVPDRGPGLLDVGIDSAGVILGITLLSLIRHYRIKQKTLEEMKQ